MTFSELENQISIQLDKLGGDFGLHIEFLKTNEVFSKNTQLQFWAASIIKIVIACTYFKQLADLKFDAKTRVVINESNFVLGSGVLKLIDRTNSYTYNDLVTLMLAVSDNSATNELIDILGIDNIEDYIKELKLANTTLKHKMMIKAGKGPNFTTAADQALLLKLLYKNSIPESTEVLTLMKEETDRRRLPLLIPNAIEIAHKTGSLEQAVHNVGIVYSKNPFIFSFLSDDQLDKQLTTNVLATCAKLCYDYSESYTSN